MEIKTLRLVSCLALPVTLLANGCGSGESGGGAAASGGESRGSGTLGPDGLADGVVYYDAEGRVHEQKARAVVLASNGIGTPRLLLNSRSGRFPAGVANGSGLVGRDLMFHPFTSVRGYFDEHDTKNRRAHDEQRRNEPQRRGERLCACRKSRAHGGALRNVCAIAQ